MCVLCSLCVLAVLDAIPIPADLAYINKAIAGDLSNWNFLDDIAKSSGYGKGTHNRCIT